MFDELKQIIDCLLVTCTHLLRRGLEWTDNEGLANDLK